MFAITRYDSRAGGGPIRTASSANRTNGASASASEYSATVAIPIARQVRFTRSAISPRFATSTLQIDRMGTADATTPRPSGRPTLSTTAAGSDRRLEDSPDQDHRLEDSLAQWRNTPHDVVPSTGA